MIFYLNHPAYDFTKSQHFINLDISFIGSGNLGIFLTDFILLKRSGQNTALFGICQNEVCYHISFLSDCFNSNYHGLSFIIDYLVLEHTGSNQFKNLKLRPYCCIITMNSFPYSKYKKLLQDGDCVKYENRDSVVRIFWINIKCIIV